MRCKKNITCNVRNITLNLENTISFFRNLIGHFTDKEKVIALILAIIMLSFANITSCFLNSSNVSALSYQNNVGLSFTFNPTLSVNISPSDLVVSNLTPGTTSDSNIINVSVATNAVYGYTLSAIMNGNNNNLTHTNGTNTFSSIATDSSLSNLTTDNTWGYSYKNNLASTPTWFNYSGLSNSISKVLFNTDSNSNGSIDFKIAAKASETQPSGTYTGTINFAATTKPMPKTIEDIAYMQTFAELDIVDLASVKSSMATNATYILKDARDEQEYTIAKLADDKIWMTKNLNLAGGTEITTGLSDVPVNYTLPIANGFQEYDRLPVSSQAGFDDDTMAYVYNTDNDTDNCSNPGCYSYYSWVAATAGSGLNVSSNNADALYSICPKGWRLPASRSYVSAISDFYNLTVAYGMNPDSIRDSSQATGYLFNSLAGKDTRAGFLLSGRYGTNPLFYNGDTQGFYWSSTKNGNGARSLVFTTSNTDSAFNGARAGLGLSVRCLAR